MELAHYAEKFGDTQQLFIIQAAETKLRIFKYNNK